MAMGKSDHERYREECDSVLLSRGRSSDNIGVTFSTGMSRDDIAKVLMLYQRDTARRFGNAVCLCCGGEHVQGVACPLMEAKS